MGSITATGMGSGLDIDSIVTQMVALEKAPLTTLQTKATAFKTKLSAYATIKSQVSALGDAAATLSKAGGWNAVTTSTSNSAAATVTAKAGTAPTSFALEVQRLAKAQTTVSSAMTASTAVGAGSLSIEIGKWSGSSFTAGEAAAVSVAIDADDTLTDIASKINKADAGVTATVITDASGQRLLMRSNATGEANGFRISADDADGQDTDAAGLSRLAYAVGNSNGMAQSQAGQNALATIDNVSISSASNTLSGTIEGITLQLGQVTTGPVQIGVSQDTAAVQANIEAFVNAYNTLSKTITSYTKYDEATETAGALQGDSTAVGLQNTLRSMVRSVTQSSPFTRLSDIGLEVQTGGTLKINSTKLASAMENMAGLQDLFTTAGGGTTSAGFGVKFQTFAEGLLESDGSLTNRTDALQASVERNSEDQDKVTERAERLRTRLLAQYNAMDTKVGQLNSISTFINQQITLWNKAS